MNTTITRNRLNYLIPLFFVLILILVFSIERNKRLNANHSLSVGSPQVVAQEPKYKSDDVAVFTASIEHPGCMNVGKKGSDVWNHFFTSEGTDTLYEGKCTNE